MLVHPLEHGRIEVQYKPGTPQQTVNQLETLLAEESDGYHMLMFQNTTNMPYAVAADRVGPLRRLPDDERQGVRRDARRSATRYIDKGPEIVP